VIKIEIKGKGEVRKGEGVRRGRMEKGGRRD
jgi:hypothetical protein